MSNMYIDMGLNNGSEKWTGKNTAAVGKGSVLRTVLSRKLGETQIFFGHRE